MFFDNQAYFDFVSKCREHGIDIPIIPGLKPLTTKRQLTSLPQNFYVNMPDELVRMIENAASKEAVKEAGVAWCIQQAKELKAANVPVLHFYTMGKAHPTAEIARAVF
jgi:methylenetetrahydrofolate reductase (NADPH)